MVSLHLSVACRYNRMYTLPGKYTLQTLGSCYTHQLHVIPCQRTKLIQTHWQGSHRMALWCRHFKLASLIVPCSLRHGCCCACLASLSHHRLGEQMHLQTKGPLIGVAAVLVRQPAPSRSTYMEGTTTEVSPVDQLAASTCVRQPVPCRRTDTVLVSLQ